jgi:hypothetical protein
MILQSPDNRTGDFSSSGFYSARLIVPWPHRLLTAKATSQNVVLTGTVELRLRFTDPDAGRGGAQIGVKLENDDLDDPPTQANSYSTYAFDLDGYEKLVAPGNRMYFLEATSTNAADRLDELVLMVDVERA